MTDDHAQTPAAGREKLGRTAGSAFLWKGIELAFNKGVSTIRLLVLANLLLPDDFGLLATGLVVTQTMLLLTDVGMTPALVQYRDAEPRHYDIAWTTECLRGVLIGLLVLIGAPLIALLFDAPAATPVIRALAFYPLIESVASIRVVELTRRLQFRSLATLRSAAILTETVLSIALAPTLGVWALVIGVLAGAAIYTTMSYLIAPYRPRLRWDWAAARPLINYGRWVLVTGLIVVAGGSLLPVVISRQIGVEGLGLYYLAVKLAFLPNEIISGVIGSVAFPIYARLQNDRARMGFVFGRLLIGLAALLTPVYALTIVLAPTLVSEVLGARWAGTVDVIRVLSVVGLLGLLGETAVPMIKGAGQPQKVMVLELIQSAMLIILVYAFAVQFGLVGVALSWVVATGVSFFFSVYFIVRLAPRAFDGVLLPLLGIGLASVAGGAVALVVDQAAVGLMRLFLAAGSAALLTGLLVWWMNRLLHMGLIDTLFQVLPQAEGLLRRLPFVQRKPLVP